MMKLTKVIQEIPGKKWKFSLLLSHHESKVKKKQTNKVKTDVSSNKLPREWKASKYDTGNLETLLRRQQDTRQNPSR